MTKEYKIGGITVEFPYKAYGPQLAYMSKVVATLERSRLRKEGRCNALLESPTGSGKSLALLCATLAWQKHYKSVLSSRSTLKREAGSSLDTNDVLVAGGGFIVEDLSTGLEPGNVNGSAPFQQMPAMAIGQAEIAPKSLKAPRIFYATRTHAQITQVIREFRKTKYRVPMAILAAKKHYCTNKEVQKNKNVDEDCLVLLREPELPGCRNFKNAGRVKDHPSLRQGACKDIHDVEDLVKIGHSVKGCAYFAARAMAMEADIVFCPYSYIVDPIIREAVEADIRGSIIIFDEAHNIEDVAREAGSIDLETSVLLEMRSELEELRNLEPTAHYCQPLLEMVQELVGWTEYQSNRLTKMEFEHHSSCWTGDKATQELRAAGIPLESFEVLLSFSRKAVAAASDEKACHLSARLVNALERLFRVLQFMLCNNARRALDYQLVVQKFVRRDKALSRPAWIVSLSLWCLNPAVVFEEISKVTRSIIVTSGTLAPVESFASELGVPFDVRIEAPHVIDMETQVWAAALSVGPREVVLNASYKNAENFLFQDAIGAALLEIFKVTPDGVLVFLPSYKLLSKLCDRWQSTGHWLLLASQKRLFIEPRVNDEKFESVLQGYYGAIKGEVPGNIHLPRKSKKKRKAQLQACAGKALTNGAAFLAVCRGKVSEGIDFSDKNARAVVVVGIPFPNVKDIQVSLKKRYNSTHQVTKNLLSGDQWYCQQAFRALNQAVGRCIRHRYDYGGIILLDERFKVTRNMEYMSKWLRKSIQQSDNFQESMGLLQDFFSRLKEVDLRASGGTPESDAIKNIPELQIALHNRAPSPVAPVPITPLKSESGVLRVSNTLELCTTSKELLNAHGQEGNFTSPMCLRSGLLTQFDATEPRPTPSFCGGDISSQQEACGANIAEIGPEFLTQPCLLQDTIISSVCNNGVSEDAQGFSLGVVSGNMEQQWSAGEPLHISGATGPIGFETDNNTVSILDDDGALYSSMEILDHDKELVSTTLGAGCKSDSMGNLASSGLNTGLCRMDGCHVKNSATAPDQGHHCFANPTYSNCFKSSSGLEAACAITHLGNRDIQSNTPHCPIMCCSRCGLNFGTITSSEIMTLRKSYLTSLLNWNRPQSQRTFGPTPVYFTDISLIRAALLEEQKPGIETSGGEIGNCKQRQSGVWVEEDGCVFKPLMCCSCTDFYIGVHIIAADNNNLALIGKVAIFVQSIRFGLENKALEGCHDNKMQASLCCQEREDSRPTGSPSKRAHIAPAAKAKLKLQRRQK